MASWLMAYGNSFLRTDKMIFNYLTTKKDKRLWIGTVESVLALCYIRFRAGAKFRLKKGFKIDNDHSHPIKFGDYQFNFQGVKRTILGGDSSDLLNFKTPMFFSHRIIDKLRPENKEIIIRIARESAQSLLDTYSKDIMAREAVQSMDLILKAMQNGEDLDEVEEFLYINEDYLGSPLTVKNMELWNENIDILNRICHLYRQAYEENQEGRNPEKYLNEIKDLQEGIRSQLEDYLLEIPRGQ